MKNKRAKVRFKFQRNIEYILDYRSDNEIFEGVITDITDEGLGLYLFNPLEVSQGITIKKGISEYFNKGIVKWCNKMGDNLYRAGMMFI